MSDVAYVSKAGIEGKVGPVQIAYLTGESQPVVFSVHGAIAGTTKSIQQKPSDARWMRVTSMRATGSSWEK